MWVKLLCWIDRVWSSTECACCACDPSVHLSVSSICLFVVVVRLPRPMEGNGVTPIFRSLQNCQFHHRRLESLEHFNVLYIYISF